MGMRWIAPLLLAAASVCAQASRPVGRLLDDDLVPALDRLRELVAEGLDRESPSGRGFSEKLVLPEKTLFVGSYDRHSNIAAHWALISWARRTGDAAAVRSLTARFGAEALRAEQAFVKAVGHRSEVRPYDDAWLLLLAREIARSSPDPEAAAAARELRADLEQRLLAFLEDATPGAGDAAGSRPASAPSRPARRRGPLPWLSGSYDSAAWALVCLQLDAAADAVTRSRVERLYRECVLPLCTSTRPSARSGFSDFLWTPAILDLSHRIAGGAHEPLEIAPWRAPPQKVTLSNCHAIGREIVKLWPAAFEAGRGDAAARRIFNDRLRTCLERKDTWDGPFLTASHWVPQFICFALWLADGRP